MFKLESYITPVILSYVEKYVKNFKPEQSQVSLWGGDASFQNLDLRLEVLEEQLNLPFTFVSGHIHELLIHVPWVKITSEPIVVTINTIECILKLKDENKSDISSLLNPVKHLETPQEETPPGYIKSIVTKVINNITINCNNLILKYVEEDIVLSINVRFLSMQTVNDKWEPAFTDVSSYEVRLQKLINIQDLTLCLDKMDASGKIEIYQDPVLYRCSMTIRLIMNYHSNVAKRASITRLDLHCQKMEFSITEQQIPMILRLVTLLMLLQSKQYPLTKEKSCLSIEENENSSTDESIQVTNSAGNNTWGMWAWNTMSSILPMDWDTDWSSEQQQAYAGHVMHFGFYVDDATITFKTVESVKEQLFYKTRKMKYKSFLTLRFSEAMLNLILQGISMTNLTIGFGNILLYPRGTCSCGFLEVIDGVQPPLYLTIGKSKSDYLKDTLFDSDAIENQGKKKIYKKDVSSYLASTPYTKLLEKNPAFCMDYVHFIEIPDDITPEKLDEFNSSYEYSNFVEERHIRYSIGNLIIRLCSGLFHRIDSIKQAANKYDYNPYITPKPVPSINELPPVTVEEYEALRENIPMLKMDFYISKSAIQLQLADHRITGVPRHRKYVESRTVPLMPILSDDPFLSIECDIIKINLIQPLYPFRLVACASKQLEISPEMLSKCYRNIQVNLQGVSSQVSLKTNCRTSIIMPCNIDYNLRMLLYSMYWKDLNTIHNSHDLKIDSITITGTKSKIMIATSIVTSIMYPDDPNNPLFCSSLYSDSCNEKGPVYLELCLENIYHEAIMSLTTTSSITNISAIKAFAHNETQQAFILSGPEDNQGSKDNQYLTTVVLQFSKDLNNQQHASILSFQFAPMKGCFDPLLLQWLNYNVTYYKLNTTCSMKADIGVVHTDSTISDTGVKKKTFPSLHESVHSSSDKEKKKYDETDEKLFKKSAPKTNESDKFCTHNENIQENLQNVSLLRKLAKLYPWWRGVVVNGCIGPMIIYLPKKTMSCIGAEGIEQAKNQALQEDESLQILVIKLPTVVVQSATFNSAHFVSYLQNLPVVLPKKLWSPTTHSFPWTIEILNFECSTIEGKLQQNFIKKLCFKATLDLTAKISISESQMEKLSLLSLCLYIDTSPIIVSLSEKQLIFFKEIFKSLTNIFQARSPRKNNTSISSTKEIKDSIPFSVPKSSSSPTQLPYHEDAMTTSTVSVIKEGTNQDEDEMNLTACIQWTITKIAFKLYILNEQQESTLKLVLELEDIITSVDLQAVYFKLKHKITTATIFHYTRESQSLQWDFGDYVGLVMCGREDNFEKSEDLGFVSFTLTIAKSGNVHTRWGARKSHTAQKKDFHIEALQTTNSYIIETVVKVQMIDIIIPPSILSNYMQLVKPFVNKIPSQDNSASSNKYFSPPFVGITNLRNDTLPLVYLDFKGFRLMLPMASDCMNELQHDLLMVQLDAIRITPHAENPICRVPLRSDIYQLAAQANILNVPGSAVEDRQYQVNVDGICIHTTTWKDYQQSVTKRLSQSYLYTMNENPAVEWNKLGNGSSLESHYSALPIISRFDFSCIIAPAIVFKPDTMVCASAVEVNCLTDLEFTVNLNQIKLISKLFEHFKSLMLLECDIEKSTYFDAVSITKTSDITYKGSFLARRVASESDTDFTKDSGVEFESCSMHSINLEKLNSNVLEFPPFELLINCGRITMIVYEIKRETIADSEDGITETEEDDVSSLKYPLLYFMVDQPNIYFSQKCFEQKAQISCFDVTLLFSDKADGNSASIPTKPDFNVLFVETKSGDPHPDTGIPPSFLVMKFDFFVGKNSQLNISLGRPTKLYFSLSQLKEITNLYKKVLACFNTELESLSKCSSSISTCVHLPTREVATPPAHILTSKKLNFPDAILTCKQLVVSFKSEHDTELLLTLASLCTTIANITRPERIYSNCTWDSFIISTVFNSKMTVLFNPCSGNITVQFAWESWQNDINGPQIQIQGESDSIYLDLGPNHILAAKAILTDFDEILSKLKIADNSRPMGERALPIVATHEQHYKDDLKSGAFQFVDGSAGELPFPYQVVFFSFPYQAMAWRYPHPRALTKIHVNPVPLETYDDEPHEDGRVMCAIEYWSESQMSYQRYVDFYISEADNYRLDLPDKVPLQAVACVWRIVILPDAQHPETIGSLSSKALIGCLRIDSYFNQQIVPTIQAAFNVERIHLSFYNQLDANFYETLPPPLANYKLNGIIPENQCFSLLELRSSNFQFSKRSDNSFLVNASSDISLQVLDYGLLILQQVLDKTKVKFQLSSSVTSDISFTSDRLTAKLSPSIFHSFTLAAYFWSGVLDQQQANRLILTTRYVIANDTNVPIRFGQSGTDDNILLGSRQCHFYSWRHATNQVLRIAVEENGWSWSKPFAINDGTYEADFSSNSSVDIIISIHITSLSATQKLVTFCGQLIISNQLCEGFEMKLVKYDAIAKNKSVVSRDTFNIPARTQPSTVALAYSSGMAMRLRFSSISNLPWTGDIPLQPNSRWGQPWLVKVPLQERGQFISIWVRIIVEEVNRKYKILAILSPLYMIRSYLPVPAKVQIETPSLKVSLNTIVTGCGAKQQLYCPGTFEHFHQLTFQIESGVSASNPYVPLSYSSVDQRKFFKRPEKESIQDILAKIESANEDFKWPFQNDELYTSVPAEQPQTHVQIKYEDAGFASSTLLLELQPWCFILNSVGAQISIVSQDIELCKIPHYGVVAPPKLDSPFHIGVSVSGTFYLTSALQLAKPDWSQTFYVQRAKGLIPLEGSIKAYIDCSRSITMIIINSSIYKDMRVLRINNNYVIKNTTSYEIYVAPLAVPNSLINLCLPTDLSSCSFTAPPSADSRYGIPIVQWYTLFGKIDESFALYISLQYKNNCWSCPIRVDQTLSRRCIALSNGQESIPLTITSQEDKSVIYITISVDKHPQLYIENMCPFTIMVAQADDNSNEAVMDSLNFAWRCQIASKMSSYYSTPTVGSKLPDLPNNNSESGSLLMCIAPTNEKFVTNNDINDTTLHWSRRVDLPTCSCEQIVHLPHCIDVKITMQIHCYTTLIQITPISQLEICSQNIKSSIENKTASYQDDITDNSLCLEEDKSLLQLQSASSSASSATFFSAKDDLLNPEINFILSSTNANLTNKAYNSRDNENKRKSQNGSIAIHLEGLSIVIMKDVNDKAQRVEVSSLCFIDTIFIINYNDQSSNLSIYVGDIQIDNQMFEQGGFDFPVVLIGQKTYTKKASYIRLSNSLKKTVKDIAENNLLAVNLAWEDSYHGKVFKEIIIKVAPISAYIEGSYVSLLVEYAASLLPACVTIPILESTENSSQAVISTSDTLVPDYILVDAKILSHPLRLQNFVIEPVSLLLSVHTSVHLYVAFDHSPLYFEAFVRKNLLTTPYRLGNALAMHYLSGAIFGVGWVVGSLEILGSPGSLAQALGTGLKDFISMPFQGLLQGPWGFIVGITHGSASLVKHVTAGTVNSVTKLASSVARNLDRLTLDDEHLQRQEESRRMRPQGVGQGLYQGLSGLGMNLLAAVAGLAHHPLQQVWAGETSTRGLVTGVGRGLVGVVTKPLSGAAELVALTGQGLLQGTGWNSLPSPRQRPVLQCSGEAPAAPLRYAWRLLPLLAKSHDNILHVCNADQVMLQGSRRAVILVLTRQALLVVNVAEDSVEKIFPLKELTAIDHPSESTVLRLSCSSTSPPQNPRRMSPQEHLEIHMDKEMRARVAEFLRTSSTGIASVSSNSDVQTEVLHDPITLADSENSLMFYINSDSRSYVLSLFNAAKRQNQGLGFIVI